LFVGHHVDRGCDNVDIHGVWITLGSVRVVVVSGVPNVVVALSIILSEVVSSRLSSLYGFLCLSMDLVIFHCGGVPSFLGNGSGGSVELVA